MDYSKTDQQLRNIGEGLKELDKENNALLFMRINAKNGEVYTQVMGNFKNLSKMIAITMINDESFRSLVFQALREFSLLRLHTEDDCKKCKDSDCKARKANYKEE